LKRRNRYEAADQRRVGGLVGRLVPEPCADRCSRMPAGQTSQPRPDSLFMLEISARASRGCGAIGRLCMYALVPTGAYWDAHTRRRMWGSTHRVFFALHHQVLSETFRTGLALGSTFRHFACSTAATGLDTCTEWHPLERKGTSNVLFSEHLSKHGISR
jgi:hypothetical protein